MKRPTVILISGAINSGKTTVAKELCRRLPGTAHVEVDALRGFIEWMPLEESIPLNLRNAAAVSKTFLESGLNVVISYPLREVDFAYFARELGDDLSGCVTLAPSERVALGNRGRELSVSERERIAEMYREGMNTPGFGVVVDNSSLSVAETAEQIIELLKLRLH